MNKLYSEKVTALVEKNKNYSSVKMIISEVAGMYNVSEDVVKKDMVKKKSIYSTKIVGYVDGEPVGRITLLYQYKRIINKIFKNIETNLTYKLSLSEKEYVLELIELELLNS